MEDQREGAGSIEVIADGVHKSSKSPRKGGCKPLARDNLASVLLDDHCFPLFRIGVAVFRRRETTRM